MKKFLENECEFKEVFKVSDGNHSTVMASYDKLINVAKCLSLLDSRALFFIYYSGHGTLQGGDTFGHTVYGEPFNLDKMARRLATNANSYVISMFDCCREVVPDIESKGGKGATSEPPTRDGQLYIIYGAAPGVRAIADRGELLSKCTDAFLSHIRSINRWTLRLHSEHEHLPALSRDVEFIQKASLPVNLLSPKRVEVARQAHHNLKERKAKHCEEQMRIATEKLPPQHQPTTNPHTLITPSTTTTTTHPSEKAVAAIAATVAAATATTATRKEEGKKTKIKIAKKSGDILGIYQVGQTTTFADLIAAIQPKVPTTLLTNKSIGLYDGQDPNTPLEFPPLYQVQNYVDSIVESTVFLHIVSKPVGEDGFL